MYFTDSHLHSNCSCDGVNTMLEMTCASHQNGVDILCFTDHCDLDDFLTGEPDFECFSNHGEILEMYEEAVSGAPSGMTIRLGIELGEINHDPERAAKIASSQEFDFVLGSVHNLRGKTDFYDMKYKDEESCRVLIDEYIDELAELSKLPCFDVMAHIGYTNRYTREQGFKTGVSLKTYGDKLEQILKTLIENGKGIEINCSGFRNPYIGGTIPAMDILRLYKDLGGEIITVGSDAHMVEQAGQGISEGFDILKQLGYKYVTVFDKRKPTFLKI